MKRKMFAIAALAVILSLNACGPDRRLVRITSPGNGSIFPSGTTISLHVDSVQTEWLEVTSNGTRILTLFGAGHGIDYSRGFNYRDAEPGVHVLVARIYVDDQAAYFESQPVCIFVTGTGAFANPPPHWTDCSTAAGGGAARPPTATFTPTTTPTLVPPPTAIIRNPTPIRRPAQPGGGACQPPPQGCTPYTWDPGTCSCGVP